MKRWNVILPCVATLAASAAAFHYYSENQTLKARLAATEEIARNKPARRAAPPPPPVPEAEENPAAVAVVDNTTPPPADEAPPRERFDRRDRGMEFMSRMLTDPDARQSMLTRMKSGVDRRYGDLIARLGLDEVQAETLRSLLAEKQMAGMEAMMLMRSGETPEDRAGAESWRNSKLAEIDSGVEAILGKEGVNMLRDYEKSGAQREAVADVSRVAGYSGAPLDQAASARLVDVMRTAQTEYPASLNPGRGDDGTRQPVDSAFADKLLTQKTAQNQAILEQSREFLTRTQLEALADKQVEEYEALQQQLSFQMRNPDMAVPGVFFDGGGGPPAGRGPGRGRGPRGGG